MKRLNATAWSLSVGALAVVLGVITTDLIRHASFANASTQLEQTWATDIQNGVPESSISPLRAELDAKTPNTPSWWINWLSFDDKGLISGLQQETDQAWNSALAGSRADAQHQIDQWNTFAKQQQSWVTASAIKTASAWPKQLAAASTPGALQGLTSQWTTFIKSQRTAVAAAQKAKWDSEIASAGGPQAMVDTATSLAATASSINLSDLGVASLADQLQATINAGGDTTPQAEKLVAAVDQLQAELDLNTQVTGDVRTLVWSTDQAQAEQTPSAGKLAAQLQTITSSLSGAQTTTQLSQIQTQASSLQTKVTAELKANQCGHTSVGSGKVITLSLSLQEMVFYQDGCVVQATPVSTGRPELRTPTGSFQIFYKQSPFTFISPWPKESPFYYFPSDANWVMEFADGGYFIHDAPWEDPNAYGPGSEDNFDSASHGCVHVPSPVMQWAYSWTDEGTPVNISS